MTLELFFEVGNVCTIPKWGGVEQDCTQFAVLILCHDSTGCDEMGDYFAIKAITLIDLNKDCFRIFLFNGNIYKIVSFKCRVLFSSCVSRQLLSKIFKDSDFCHNYLYTLCMFACLLQMHALLNV